MTDTELRNPVDRIKAIAEREIARNAERRKERERRALDEKPVKRRWSMTRWMSLKD